MFWRRRLLWLDSVKRCGVEEFLSSSVGAEVRPAFSQARTAWDRRGKAARGALKPFFTILKS